MKWAVNLFCAVGVALGVIPIFFSWVSVDTPEHFGALEVVLGDTIHSGCPCFRLSAALFIIGTLIAIGTTLGTVVQIAGLALFLLASPFHVTCHNAYCIYNAEIGFGFVSGALSAAVILASIAFPTGITSEMKLLPLENRMLTFQKIV